MKDLSRTAVVLVIAGAICMFLIPFLLSLSGKYTLDEKGKIGDAIGGVTAPLSSLIGSILVFLALRAQILANITTQAQIHDQMVEEQRKKEVIYVSDLYKYFLNSIQSFETKYYKGHKAIMKIMSLLAQSEKRYAHDESRLYYGTAAELLSILQLGKQLLEQVNNSSVAEQDVKYFKSLVRHHYDSFILPYLAQNSDKKSCEICGEMHNGLPMKMLSVIQQTLLLF